MPSFFSSLFNDLFGSAALDPQDSRESNSRQVEREPMTTNLFYVEMNGKCGYINHKGELAIPFQFEMAGDFSEGLAPVTISGKTGFINVQGEVVIKPQFDEMENGFSEGLVQVAINDRWGYIDRNGREVVPLIYSRSFPFTEGVASVRRERHSPYGYINRQGKYAIAPRLGETFVFGEGLAAVKLGSGWG